MTAERLIALSAVVEPWMATALAAGSVVIVANALLSEKRNARVPLHAPISARTERGLLALILFIAATTRTVGWRDGLTAPFFPSEVMTLQIAALRAQGTLWDTWRHNFFLTQVSWAHESFVLLPFIAAVEALLGPRFGLPVLSGAVLGVLAVWLAWALGRRVHSQAFGLAFAALIACSPLEVTWSRLGAHYIGAVPHVLLAVLVGYIAGRRVSALLAIGSGLVAWASVYQYLAARVAIPLVVMGLLAGAARSSKIRLGLALSLVAGLVFGAIDWKLHGSAPWSSLWPAYQGYVGSRGETSFAELVRTNAAPVLDQVRVALGRYVFWRRTSWEAGTFAWGMRDGGLSLLPTSLLGLVGVLVVVRSIRRQCWLVIAISGLALPALSVTSARRLLVFDVACCAFAAHGLLALVEWVASGASRYQRSWMVSVVLVTITAWSVTAVFALNASLPRGAGQHIPFGDAGFGDGITCLRCLEAAKGWQHEIADGAFIALFDNDLFRENNTAPGGLEAYGKIAALAAGRPERFIEGYALMANWDAQPMAPSFIFDPARPNFATYLADRIERSAPQRIVWHFERPTLWERWLVRRLAAAGGEVEPFSTPLSPTPGLRVVTPWDERAAALDVLRDVAAGLDPGSESRCFTLRDRGGSTIPGPIFFLAPVEVSSDGDQPPNWIRASWADALLDSTTIPTGSAAIGARLTRATDGYELFDMIGQTGDRLRVDLGSQHREQTPSEFPISHGLNCAAYAGEHWWTVEPWTGRVFSSHPAAPAVPVGSWVGIAADPGDNLVLVSADQEVLIFDPTRGASGLRFPAYVPPAVRIINDECSLVAAGAGWIAMANGRSGVLALYDRAGHDLGTRRLDKAMGAGPPPVSAIAAYGSFLGAAAGNVSRTFEVSIDRSCLTDTPPAPAR